MDLSVHYSSETDVWATPQAFYDELNTEFKFVLDPCSSQRNNKTPTYYAIDHSNPARRNGLEADWATEAKQLGGAVFMNPPYGRAIGNWVAKAAATASQGVTVVCLLPARTDTRWFHDHCIKHECRFIKGRLKFGNAKNSAPFPSVVVIMR